MTRLAELAKLIRRHAATARPRGPLENVTLTAMSGPDHSHGSTDAPSVSFIAQGSKVTTVGDVDHAYEAGDYIVVPLAMPVTARLVEASAARPFMAMTLGLRPAAIAALLLEEDPAVVPPTGHAALGVGRADEDLLDAAVRLLRLLDRPGDAHALAPGYEREIAWLLLRGSQGAMVRQIGLADGRLTAVARSIDWIRRHYDEKLRVEDLARIANSSDSSFHRQFRSLTRMTPIQFQKRIRLQEARTRLIADPDSVAAVAFAVGYESPSQFSRDYRRLFGAAPGEDAKRLRVATPG